ncbi:hypothetical protein E2C01_051623 [Portunus trituberculatus]|uniref:Uncharacterized protein n=1 Tax=Portunus trituberculatus TaxID=210409 RepID=A0A5B7GKU5_PORTR|nr:hypothetical protein [Portunus trituberculatus]
MTDLPDPYKTVFPVYIHQNKPSSPLPSPLLPSTSPHRSPQAKTRPRLRQRVSPHQHDLRVVSRFSGGGACHHSGGVMARVGCSLSRLRCSAGHAARGRRSLIRGAALCLHPLLGSPSPLQSYTPTLSLRNIMRLPPANTSVCEPAGEEEGVQGRAREKKGKHGLGHPPPPFVYPAEDLCLARLCTISHGTVLSVCLRPMTISRPDPTDTKTEVSVLSSTTNNANKHDLRQAIRYTTLAAPARGAGRVRCMTKEQFSNGRTAPLGGIRCVPARRWRLQEGIPRQRLIQANIS